MFRGLNKKDMFQHLSSRLDKQDETIEQLSFLVQKLLDSDFEPSFEEDISSSEPEIIDLTDEAVFGSFSISDYTPNIDFPM